MPARRTPSIFADKITACWLNFSIVVTTFTILLEHSQASPVLYYKPILSRTLQIENKECTALVRGEAALGHCMFNFQCHQQEGTVIGACIDGFLFGACCDLSSTKNNVNHKTESETKENALHENFDKSEISPANEKDVIITRQDMAATTTPVHEDEWVTEMYLGFESKPVSSTNKEATTQKTTISKETRSSSTSTTALVKDVTSEMAMTNTPSSSSHTSSTKGSIETTGTVTEGTDGGTTWLILSSEDTTGETTQNSDFSNQTNPTSQTRVTTTFSIPSSTHQSKTSDVESHSDDKLITFTLPPTEPVISEEDNLEVTSLEQGTDQENATPDKFDPLATWTTLRTVESSSLRPSAVEIPMEEHEPPTSDVPESLMFWTTPDPMKDLSTSDTSRTPSTNGNTISQTTGSMSTVSVPATSWNAQANPSSTSPSSIAPDTIDSYASAPSPSVPLKKTTQIVALMPNESTTAEPHLDVNLLIQLLNLTNYIPEEGIFIPPSVIAASVIKPSNITTQTPVASTNNVSIVREDVTSSYSEIGYTTTSSTTPETTTTTSTTTTTTQSTTTKKWDWKKTCGVRPLVREGRIVNGRRSDFGEWPWQALVRESTWLGIFTKNKCGGVLLNSRYVLTAAHCKPGFLASLIVVLGELDVAGEYEPKKTIQRNVKRVVVHKGFVARTFDNDLALLELEKPVDFDEHVLPICMPQGEDGFVGRTGFVSGWGRLSYQGSIPNRLHNVAVPVIPNNDCQRWFREAGHAKKIKPEFMCAGFKLGKKDSCEGDSGGPLSMRGEDGRWLLAGIVSHGIKCAYPNLPGIYMRMTYYRPWIESVINS